MNVDPTPLMTAMDEAKERALEAMWQPDSLRWLLTPHGRAQLKVELASQGQSIKLSAIEPESFRGIPITLDGEALNAQRHTVLAIARDFSLVGVGR